LSQSVLRIPTPGAETSMCGPVLEKLALVSLEVVAATATTPG
jgi:hypothetical protein